MLVDQDRLHQLKEDAKWGSSIEGQIKAVKELGTFGEAARQSLEEVMQISVREDIKQCCIEAIRKLGRDNKHEAVRKKAPKTKSRRRKHKQSR